MNRSELKQIIREVIEEGKKNLDGPGSYTTPVEVGEFTITGWGRDTNGNSVIKYSFVEDGKEKNKSSQLGGLIGPLNDFEYKDREKGPGKKLIAAFKEAIDKEWTSVPKRLKGKKVEESKVLPRRRIVQEESDKKENLVDILKGNKTLVRKINDMINNDYLDLFDSVEAVAKRNLKDFGGLDIDEVIEQIKTLKKYDTRKGLVMEESKVLPRRRIVQESNFDEGSNTFNEVLDWVESKDNLYNVSTEYDAGRSISFRDTRHDYQIVEQDNGKFLIIMDGDVKEVVKTGIASFENPAEVVIEMFVNSTGYREESRRLPRRRIVQEAVQTPKSLKKVASKLKKIVTDNYPDIMSLEDLPVPLQNKLEAEADHELFWQDADRYIGDLYNELGR